MNRYGPRQRTHADKVIDALTFAITAPAERVALMTPESICARYGVTKADSIAKVRDAVARRAAR